MIWRSHDTEVVVVVADGIVAEVVEAMDSTAAAMIPFTRALTIMVNRTGMIVPDQGAEEEATEAMEAVMEVGVEMGMQMPINKVLIPRGLLISRHLTRTEILGDIVVAEDMEDTGAILLTKGETPMATILTTTPTETVTAPRGHRILTVRMEMSVVVVAAMADTVVMALRVILGPHQEAEVLTVVTLHVEGAEAGNFIVDDFM